jgi:hypothetical protein
MQQPHQSTRHWKRFSSSFFSLARLEKSPAVETEEGPGPWFAVCMGRTEPGIVDTVAHLPAAEQID